MAAAASDVKDELAAIQKANARIWGARGAALAAGALAFYAGTFVLETFGGPRFRVGLSEWFLLCIVAIAAALFTNHLLGPKPEASRLASAVTGGVFDDSIATTGSVSVRQKLTLASLLFGAMSKDQYEMIDGGQAFCGQAAETSGFFSRLFLGGRRPINVSVDDLGNEAMRVRRGFLWLPFFNRAEVHEGQRSLGRIEQRISPLRRYVVRGPEGGERYELRSGLIFRSKFKLLRGGQEVGELRRVREPWYIRLFTPSWRQKDQFSLVFPQGSPLEDRKLLIGSVFLVDITPYPTQASFRWTALAILVLALLPAPPEDAAADGYEYDRVDRPAYDIDRFD
jgi:hypothetical protein